MEMTQAKVPMAWAAKVLADVCDEIDQAGNIDAFLTDAFSDATMALSDAVDRRIAFDRWIKIQVEATEEGYRYYRERKAVLENVHARFKEKTKEIIEAAPEIPYAGKLGKIYLAKSPVCVDYTFGSKELSPAAAQMFGVPDDYLIATTTYRVDSMRVKTELEAGKELPFASLRQGTHIRFPAQRKPKEIGSDA